MRQIETSHKVQEPVKNNLKAYKFKQDQLSNKQKIESPISDQIGNLQPDLEGHCKKKLRIQKDSINLKRRIRRFTLSHLKNS